MQYCNKRNIVYFKFQEQLELENLNNVTPTEQAKENGSSRDITDNQDDVLLQETETMNAPAERERETNH